MRARARLQRIAARAGLVTVGAAVLITLLVAGFTTLANRASEATSPDRGDTLRVTLAAAAPPSEPAPKPQPQPPPKAAEPARQGVADGRADLGDGISAQRRGDEVIVRFDTPEFRTRRYDKFERVVRRTLPSVWGTRAQPVLDSISIIYMSRAGDLLTELPDRGLHFASDSGPIMLWPITRPGEDGPLVIAYRATVLR